MFSDILGGLWTVAKAAAPILAIGGGIKHAAAVPILKQTIGRVTKLIPNDAIPIIGIASDILLGGSGEAGAAAVGVHQIAKTALRLFAERALSERVKNAVGPGSRLSI
jgi:hypothetical protein